MKTMSIYDDLHQRGLILQQSDESGIREHLSTAGSAVYIGFDPTANSLHIGSLVPLIALRRFQLAGHSPIALMGGATGLIGDPSGKTEERRLNEKDTVDKWVADIRRQVANILDFDSPSCSARIVNNYDWIGALSAIHYLRDVGKHFSVNAMCAKDSVRSRLERAEVGISYTEFSYMILQAYDFLHLYEQYGCCLQAGGNDQWGNMTAGIELIRRKHSAEAYALTFPLITTASGKKFGKTEQGTIWLDPDRTSPYAFYQFWLNVEDADVIRFLKYFTLLSLEEILKVAESVRSQPEKREAQRLLAAEVTRLVHGDAELQKVLRVTAALFADGDFDSLDVRSIEDALASVPHVCVARPLPATPISALLVKTHLVPSLTQARKAIESGGVYVNAQRVTDPQAVLQPEHFLQGQLALLRRGKKNYAVVSFEA